MGILISKELSAVRNAGPAKPADARTEPAKPDSSSFKRALENNQGVRLEAPAGAAKNTNLNKAPNNNAAGEKTEDKSVDTIANRQLEAAAMMLLSGLAVSLPVSKESIAATDNEKTGSASTADTTLQDLFAKFNTDGVAAAAGSAAASAGKTLEDLFAKFNVGATAAASSADSNSATTSAGTTLEDLFAKFNDNATAAANRAVTTLEDLFANINADTPEATNKAISAAGMLNSGLTAETDSDAAIAVVDKTQKAAGKPEKKRDTGMPDISEIDSQAKTSGEAEALPYIKQLKAAVDSVTQALDKHPGSGHSADMDKDDKGTANSPDMKTEAAFLQQDSRTNTWTRAAEQRIERSAAQAAVSEKAFVLTKKDEASIGISIEPDGLGKLDIQLSLDKGTVNAHINASDNAGKDMLDKNLRQIMDALAKEGLNVGGFSVSLRNKNGYQNNSADKDSSGNGYARSIKAIENSAQLPVYAGNNLINIFV